MAVVKFERKPAPPGRGPYSAGRPPTFRLSPNFLPILALFLVAGGMLWTGLMTSKPLVFAFVLAGWMISLCVHEFGHAVAAFYGGDRSVAGKGYLTLDPLAYTHWQISILFPMLILALGYLGLPGGAVYVNTSALRSKQWDSFVSAAGPLGTLACLLVLCVPIWLGFDHTYGTVEFWAAWHLLAYLQVSALVLNLLPIPGFDGFGIIRPFLPHDMQAQANNFAQISALIFFGLLIAVPAFGEALGNMMYAASVPFGVDIRFVAAGFGLFRFWKW